MSAPAQQGLGREALEAIRARHREQTNSGRDCVPAPSRAAQAATPDHIVACTCPEHQGYCANCNFKISIGTDGAEHGHARRWNQSPRTTDGREDCEHRCTSMDPNRSSPS